MSTSLALNPGQMTLVVMRATWLRSFVLAIEWLAAALGSYFLNLVVTNSFLEQAQTMLRDSVSICDQAWLFGPDIDVTKSLVFSGALSESHQNTLEPLGI
ncbi:hypothetical protein [Hydrogenophaga taeniospiralis]|uniref:hypothetical protein n=1 Tax=Hydrogenophaga taeniospiralis TaxID=65656 RepID=UPI001CFAFA80|nr:hypothetical protein [Hydrogenophaga taeniospiralis]UCU92353.1 hypothetical protein KI616_16020 [Hydrogenophaga taeniospiralis]